jgi:hypothetical protein
MIMSRLGVEQHYSASRWLVNGREDQKKLFGQTEKTIKLMN